LGERRAAAGTPLGRSVALVEPAALVHRLQHPPDVRDVGVAERVVVGAPVHPLPEPLRAPDQLRRRPDDDLPALRRELLQAVVLDRALRVQPELALDPDLDPKALAVEAVLVALVEPAQRLVALEDVLERPAPRRVDRELLVRRDRPVDEAPARPAAIPLAETLEDVLPLPPVEHLDLEGRVVRNRWESCKRAFQEGHSRVRALAVRECADDIRTFIQVAARVLLRAPYMRKER